MKKIIIVLLLFILTNITLSQVHFQKGSLDDVMQLAKEQKKVLMVDVLTDWCKWCIELDNKVYSRKDVSDFANSYQINYKIDAEKGEGIDFAKKYKVRGYPTILFLDSEGNEIDRIYGYVPAKEFMEMMIDYNKGINTYSYLINALQTDPNNVEANLKFAEKLMTLDELDKAREHLNKIIEVDPQNSLGKTDDAKFKLASLSDKKIIITELLDFIKENPDSDQLRDAYIVLAESYFYVNEDPESSEKYFREALSLFPDDEMVQSSYGQFLNSKAAKIMNDSLATEKNIKEGLLFIEAALPFVKGSVNEASSFYIQAKLLFTLKDYHSALEAINKSLKIFDRKLYRDHKKAVEERIGKQ